MSDLSTWTLNALVTYGVPILLIMSYGGSLGIPFPVSLAVMAAGAFARQGVIDWRLAFLACTAGAVLADSSEFALGRRAAGWLERRFGQRKFWQTGQATFARQGGWAIFLTRFWLIPLAPVVNLIAGDRFSYPRFFLFDFSGQFMWVLINGGLGYLFADEWPLIRDVISDFTGLSIGIIALAVGIYIFVRWRRNKK